MSDSKNPVHEPNAFIKSLDENLHLAISVSKLGIFDFNPAKDEFHWDQRTDEIFGYELPNPKSRREFHISILHPQDRDEILAHFQEIFTKRSTVETFDRSYRVLHKNNTIRHIRSIGSYTRDTENKITRIIGTCSDITAEVEIIEARAVLAKRNQALLDTAFDGFILSDRRGNLLEVNQSFAALLGYQQEDLVHMNIADIEKLHSPKKIAQVFQEVLATGSAQFESRLAHKNGKEIDIEVNISVWEGKEDTYFIAWVRDISERKKSQLNLEKSEKRFEQIVQVQTELVLRWKPGGIIVFANEAYCNFVDRGLDEFIGKSFYPWISPENIYILEQDIKSLSPQKATLSKSYEDLDKQGNRLWVEWSHRAFFDEEGSIYEVQSIGRDITARKSTELRLISSEGKYRSLFEKAHDAIFIADIESFELIDCNKKAIEMFGYDTKEAFLSRCLAQLSPANQSNTLTSADKFNALLEELNQQRYYFTQWKHQRKDKQILYSEASLSLIEIGNKQYLQSSVRDISKRLAAEQRLSSAYFEVARLKKQLEQENRYLQQEIQLSNNFENIVFASTPFRDLLQKVEQVAPVDTTVLILGETGTGKELIARAVHNLSERKHKTLVKVSCAALPRELLESELFGHEKGAFTGAFKQKMGRFELANNGTLFLDEIGELPIDLQAKLLRVIQEGEFERIGGIETLKINVRIIAATNRDLKRAIQKRNL